MNGNLATPPYLFDHLWGELAAPLLQLPRGEGVQRVRDSAVLDPQRQVGAVDLQRPLEAVEHRLRVFPYGHVALQLVGVELLLDAAGAG